jgi:hypothetical protein
VPEAATEEIIWTPNPGPQYEFVGSVEREVLYGGAAGGGKSDGLLLAAAMEYENRAHRAIIFRRSFPELKDLIRRSLELYPYLGGRYKSSSKEWFFKSGAIIEFGYIAKKNDKLKYQGRAFNFIGWDELTHWPDDTAYVYLLSRLRAVKGANVHLRVRATTNPGGPGHGWVMERWKIPGEGTASEVFCDKTKTWRIFIPARICDNPPLAGTSYEDDLDALPEDTRKMLKEGRWDVVAGAMFSEFDHRKHVCDPFKIEATWKLWRGADDGYNAPACVLWAAEYDHRIYIIDELYRSGMTPEAMAEETKKRDLMLGFRQDSPEDPPTNSKILDGAIDSSAFNEDGLGNSLGTGRGQVMNTLGCRWVPAQKGPDSRVAGWNLIHSKLRPLKDLKPGLIIFRNCKNLIRTIPILPKSETKPEDVDQDYTDDHAADALRYLLQFKPNRIEQRKLKGF